MPKVLHGKRYRSDAEKVTDKALPITEALAILKQFKPAKFDQTVELSLFLGVDPKQADQQIRGAISLPHGIGRSKKVIAFCDADGAVAAKAAGATEAGADELIQKVMGGWADFDVAVATPAMMRSVSKLGRVLGPQGKMPSPKSGTVVEDIATAVKEYSAGKLEFRIDDNANIHAPVGKMSFESEKLKDNIEAFLQRIRAMKPPTSKGAYFRRATLSGTMTPSVQLEVLQ
jgi:large subunit ribosomal protein L1